MFPFLVGESEAQKFAKIAQNTDLLIKFENPVSVSFHFENLTVSLSLDLFSSFVFRNS